MFAEPGKVEMHVHIDPARCGDHSFAVANGGGRRNEKTRIDAIHDGGIAGLAEADHAAVLDAEVALDDADHRINNQNVAHEQIERALRAGHACRKSDAITQRLAATVQALIAVDCVILLDDGDQRRIGKADAVANRRAVKGRVIPACNRDHG